MKVKDQDQARATMLLSALIDFRDVAKTARKDGAGRYTHAIEVSVAEMQDGEGQGSHAYLYLDIETGRKLLPLVRKLIKDELKALGVET